MQQRTWSALVAVAFAVAAHHATANAEPLTAAKGTFGLGLELGAPTGLNAKYFLGGTMAIQGGVGVVEGWYHDGLHLHAEAIWHPVVLTRTNAFVLPLYVGIGGRLLDHDDRHDRSDRCYDGRVYYDCSDTHLGLRAPVGLDFLFQQAPLDLFVELALVVDVVYVGYDPDYMHHHDAASLYGALGGRYYF